jgi:hypothetical protein
MCKTQNLISGYATISPRACWGFALEPAPPQLFAITIDTYVVYVYVNWHADFLLSEYPKDVFSIRSVVHYESCAHLTRILHRRFSDQASDRERVRHSHQQRKAAISACPVRVYSASRCTSSCATSMSQPRRWPIATNAAPRQK